MLTHRVTIFEVPHEALGRTLVLSVITHVLLVFSVFFLPGIVSSTKEPWGDANAGGSGAISVGMVQNIRGLNLPQPEITTQTKIASESKGLGQTEPVKTEVKAPEVPDPKAFEVQEKKKEPKKQERPAQKAPPQVAQNAPPKEVVPFGEGGTPGFTYSQFSAAGGSGGIGVGDGMFGSKYGWYVKQIRDIVSANWQRSMVDANVRSAPRAYIYFEIQRDGSVANESVKESSGVPSLDRSGLRAIRASRFPPLPGGETRLTVEFYFEYSR
jgi:periplasmic protein TonB